MKPLFFVSDIHLGAGLRQERQHRSDSFIRFVNDVARQNGDLIIAGDLFDFWFEYSHVIPRRHLAVLMALRDLVQHGADVHFIGGNHDFWLNQTFTHDMGIAVHRDSMTLQRDGKRYLITHGDGLAGKDRGYRLLKRILRNPLNIRFFRLLHPDWGIALADLASNISRKHQPFHDDDTDYIAYAEKKLASGLDGVIMGHTHRPLLHRSPNGIYLNLGDLIDNKTFGMLKNGTLSLETWPDDKHPQP